MELIRHIDEALLIGGKGSDEAKMPRSRCQIQSTQRQQQFAVEIEHLDVVEVGIGNIDVALGIHRQSSCTGKLSVTDTRFAEAANEIAFRVKDLYSEISRVENDQRSVASHLSVDTMGDGLRGVEQHLGRLEEYAKVVFA